MRARQNFLSATFRGVEHRPALLYTHAVASGRITAADMARGKTAEEAQLAVKLLEMSQEADFEEQLKLLDTANSAIPADGNGREWAHYRFGQRYGRP